MIFIQLLDLVENLTSMVRTGMSGTCKQGVGVVCRTNKSFVRNGELHPEVFSL
jgi:hypothetical protein